MEANEIKMLRKRLKLTQEQLAHKLKVDKATISYWEAGVSRPSLLARRQLRRLEAKHLRGADTA